MYDLLLKGGRVIDYSTQVDDYLDIGIKDGKIVKISKNISNIDTKVLKDITGRIIFPGIIDTHVHISKWLGEKEGHKMLILNGVTTAFDFAGPIEGVLEIASKEGLGINLACINYIRPGDTVKDNNPSKEELESFLDESLKKGALGYKILGGHYPLTKESIEKAIYVANEKKAYVAAHAGSTENGSNYLGLEEMINLSKGKNLHIAHVNSYCRGDIYSDEKEAYLALELLKNNKNIISESYLSSYNGTSSNCKDNIPESMVTIRCLERKSYDKTEDGLSQAIKDGYCFVNASIDNENILLTKEDGLDYWNKNNRKGSISFPVNPAISRYILATGKDKDGKFIVDAFSSDGGGIPRNEILYQGLNLVKFGAIDLFDFVEKSSFIPSKMLGLPNKGSIKEGKDADLIVVDYEKNIVLKTIINGKVIMEDGDIYPEDCRIITTDKGINNIKKYKLDFKVVDLEIDSLLYNNELK